MSNRANHKSQDAFKIWVQQRLPNLAYMFDFENETCLEEKVEDYFTLASHSENIIGHFLMTIWHQNDFWSFDFIDAAKTLDGDQMRVITDWLVSPAWPNNPK